MQTRISVCLHAISEDRHIHVTVRYRSLEVMKVNRQGKQTQSEQIKSELNNKVCKVNVTFENEHGFTDSHLRG